MYRKYFTFLGLLLLSVPLFITNGCDSILPDEFQQKEFSSEAIDIEASNLLARDTTGYPANFYIINASTSLLDTLTQAEFDTLVNHQNATPIIRDSLILLLSDTTNNVAYGVFNASAGQSKDIYFYVSLMYTQNNMADWVNIQFLRRDGSILSSTNDLTMEAVSSGTQSVDVSGRPTLVPTIRGRYSIHVDEGQYLVRFTKSSAANIGLIFKILILSR